MGEMVRLVMKRTLSLFSKCPQRQAGLGVVCALITVCLACTVLVSCASSPEYPVPPPPISAQVDAGFMDTFKAAMDVLDEDPRVELHTRDKTGRLIAYEKTGGFVFSRHRTILDLRLESVSPEETKISMQLSAEDYEMGGFTLPAGWYPSAKIDKFLGEDLLRLIEKRVEQGPQ